MNLQLLQSFELVQCLAAKAETSIDTYYGGDRAACLYQPKYAAQFAGWIQGAGRLHRPEADLGMLRDLADRSFVKNKCGVCSLLPNHILQLQVTL